MCRASDVGYPEAFAAVHCIMDARVKPAHDAESDAPLILE